MTFSQALTVLFLFVAGVVALATAFSAVLDGLFLQAGAFAVGGLYVVAWSGLRMIPARAER